jgi:hypothetical protein
VALVVDAPAAASRKRDAFFFGAIYKNKNGERFFVDTGYSTPRIIAMPHLERGPTSHEHD